MKKNVVEYTMTVADVFPPQGDDNFSKVTFYQSQRFYKLPNDANPTYIKLLKEAKQNKTPVTIKRAYEESDVILSVKKPKQEKK